MDTKQIEKLAKSARSELLKETSASLYRILAKGSTERLTMSLAVSALEDEIKVLGETALIERVAYTWFNRFCAFRFMDVHGYTPVGVVSPREDATTIAILADAQKGVFPTTFNIPLNTKLKVSDLLSGSTPSPNPLNDAYKELLVAVCDYYSESMGYLFGGRGSLASTINLLIPDDLISLNSILRRIYTCLDSDNCQSVEVLGWLYQFYIAERKDEVFAGFRMNRKAGAAEIAPATQLFTPNWIVRYMVENSLGRLWLLNKPYSKLRQKMHYYIENDGELEYPKINLPTEIKCLDPACGSGHILVYMFDLLFEMYEESGYQPEGISELILTNNLSGFEIDARAAEIASFALEMKALERDPSFLSKCIDANITVFEKVSFDDDELSKLPFLQGRTELLDALENLDEIGSLYQPSPSDMLIIDSCRHELQGGTLFTEHTREKIKQSISQCETLSQQFEIVVANPPYMGSKNMNNWLSIWLRVNYPDEKSDLCTCFIERGFSFTNKLGCSAMVTMQSWMFLSSYESMRGKMLRNRTILTMAHLGAHAFDAIGGEVVSTTATVFHRAISIVDSLYIRLVDLAGEAEKDFALMDAVNNTDCEWLFRRSSLDFALVPGSPIAYWVSNETLSNYKKGLLIGEICEFIAKGIFTGDNNLFIRYWYEICDSDTSSNKWKKYSKGGEYRKWYGNDMHVLLWENGTGKLALFPGAGLGASQYFGRQCINWSKITSSVVSFRMNEGQVFFDDASPAVAINNNYKLLGFLNSTTAMSYLSFLSPTLNAQIGEIKKLPYICIDIDKIDEIVKENVNLSKQDWDSFETSWDFQHHPLV